MFKSGNSVSGKAGLDLSTELLLSPTGKKSKNWFFNQSIQFYFCAVYTFYMAKYIFKNQFVWKGVILKLSYLEA